MKTIQKQIGNKTSTKWDREYKHETYVNLLSNRSKRKIANIIPKLIKGLVIAWLFFTTIWILQYDWQVEEARAMSETSAKFVWNLEIRAEDKKAFMEKFTKKPWLTDVKKTIIETRKVEHKYWAK